MLLRKRREVGVRNLACSAQKVCSQNAIVRAHIVGYEFMSWIGEELAQNSEGHIGRQCISEQWVGRNAGKAQLHHRPCGKFRNSLQPLARRGVMLMVLPDSAISRLTSSRYVTAPDFQFPSP